MADASTIGQLAALQRSTTSLAGTAARSAGLALIAISITGCAGDAPSRRPIPVGYAAYEPVAQRGPPSDAVYTGWRLFQHRCAACHGAGATGTARGPNLLHGFRQLDQRKFITDILYRYDWGIPAARSNQDAIDGLIEDVQNRGPQGRLTVPFWQGEPQVSANIVDLYDYLLARANGQLGPWRPPR